jgi:DUF4097 and DUF4098 domain-containing protein YvlB
MPTFDTPDPISVTIELGVGDVLISASDRSDTVVEVRPTDPSDNADTKAAERTRVNFSHGALSVTGPKQRGLFGKAGSVDVMIELPAASTVRARSQAASVRSEGQLGDCTITNSVGHVRLARTGALELSTGGGDVTVEHVAGDAEVSTGTGRIRIGKVDGTATIKNSNGASWVGEISGNLQLKASNGDIAVDRAGSGVEAKTANGDVRVGEVVRGTVELQTATGHVEIGIREGTAALLDVRSSYGRIENALETTEGPGQSDEVAEIRARTSFGDIAIRRS